MKSIIILILSILLLFSCKKSGTGPGNGTNNPPTDTTKTDTITNASFFAKGADVSWLTQMEAAGIKFYDRQGVQHDLFQILKSEGMNSIRLRVWVNPADNYNNIDDVVAKALRAKNAGMQVMIDFHYSDTWADPGHQTKPAAWEGENITALEASVHNHTVSVMNALKTAGVIPAWAQIGNETNDGMLWPEGQASTNMGNFAMLINAGYDAVKSVSDTTKVIVHISNGYDNNLFRYIFDGLKANGTKWDIIGMSLYPSASNWSALNSQCLANMDDMVSRYNKPVMICETGMSWTDSIACKSFLSDIIEKNKSVTGGKGLGVLYWEPEAYNWQGYTFGAFDESGKPTVALDAFK